MKRLLLNMFCVFYVVGFLAACDESAIVHDLNERDANEIIVLLGKNNILATKHKEVINQEVFWVIKVSKDDEKKSQTILVANNLPKIRQGGLKGICEDTSMIVTEETEKCRKLLAYKGEIINSLESIPGVVSADVVLNIPDREEFPDENTPSARPTAAVTIKYLTDANVRTELTEGKIQEFVANSISELDSRDVTVIISFLEQKMQKDLSEDHGQLTGQSQAQNMGQTDTNSNLSGGEVAQDLVSVGGIMMDERSAKKFKIISALFLILLLLLSTAFIYALLKMAKLRKQSSVEAIRDDQGDGDKKLLEA